MLKRMVPPAAPVSAALVHLQILVSLVLRLAHGERGHRS